MFCNKGANKQIDRTHKNTLQILYIDYESSFEALLNRNRSNSIQILAETYDRNLQIHEWIEYPTLVGVS